MTKSCELFFGGALSAPVLASCPPAVRRVPVPPPNCVPRQLQEINRLLQKSNFLHLLLLDFSFPDFLADCLLLFIMAALDVKQDVKGDADKLEGKSAVDRHRLCKC
jgi:hypothetical protein